MNSRFKKNDVFLCYLTKVCFFLGQKTLKKIKIIFIIDKIKQILYSLLSFFLHYQDKIQFFWLKKVLYNNFAFLILKKKLKWKNGKKIPERFFFSKKIPDRFFFSKKIPDLFFFDKKFRIVFFSIKIHNRSKFENQSRVSKIWRNKPKWLNFKIQQ